MNDLELVLNKFLLLLYRVLFVLERSLAIHLRLLTILEKSKKAYEAMFSDIQKYIHSKKLFSNL